MIAREDAGEVTVLRMKHGKANALDLELFQDLSHALDEVEASSTRAVVLTGTASIFSAGVNLFKLLEGGAGYPAVFLPALTDFLRRVFFYPKPVVAAVNGHAIAGGCVLVCASDHRVLARGPGRMGVTELLVGLPFPAVALEVMRFALPAEHFQPVVYTGQTSPVDEAERRGLVDLVVEPGELLPTACRLAQSLAALPHDAFILTKAQIRQPVRDFLDARAEEIDREVLRLWSSADARASIARYVEGRLARKPK